METAAKKPDLSATQLRNWPPVAFMAEAKRTVRLWSSHPAFSRSNGGLFSNPEDLANEIVVRVLDYLHKKPEHDEIDQVTFFHQIARYCQPGIIQDNYSIPSVAEGIESALQNSKSVFRFPKALNPAPVPAHARAAPVRSSA